MMIGVRPLGNIVTKLLMHRAGEELEKEDITLAIVLSAMAVEGEMAWLFFHWTKFDLIPPGVPCTRSDEERWEGEWDEMRSVKLRLHRLSLLLTETDFDAFAFQNKALFRSVRSDYDAANTYTSPKLFFQKQLFEKRNRIVHFGEIDYQRSDGEMCFSLASALLRILNAMHEQRIKRMDADLAKSRESIVR
jgi:hypothetical protein